MRKCKYSKEFIEIVRKCAENSYYDETIEEVYKLTGVRLTKGMLKNIKDRNGIKSNPTENYSKLFPVEVKQFIRNNVKGLYNKDLTELVNKTFGTDYKEKQIDSFKQREHLSSGLTGWFEKGSIPQNKGKKMSKEQYEKCKATMFKKGQIPHNARPIGSERVTVDGYIEKKTAEPDRWELKHRIVYKEKYGEIPKGHVIVFLDGNRQNCDINNLTLISNGVHGQMNYNGLRSKDKEITQANISILKIKEIIKNKGAKDV